MEKEIDGVKAVFPEEMSEEEAAQYVQRGKRKYGDKLRGIEIEISEDQQDALLTYDVPPAHFQRLRRITGKPTK